MKRSLPVLVLLFSLSILAAAAPVASNIAYVMVNDSPLYQDNPDKTLKYLEAITLGDSVTLVNKTATFKESGKDRDFTRVKAPSGKEGWVRTQFIAAKATLAVVKAEPRDVKVTSRSISAMTVVAVMSDGSTAGFSKVQGYDGPKNVLFDSTSPIYMIPTDLSTSDADIQAAILFTVASASKSADVKKSLLKLAQTKYPGSIFISRIEAVLSGAPAAAAQTGGAAPPAGVPDHIPVRLNSEKEDPNAMLSFDAVLNTPPGGDMTAVTNVTATSWLVEANVTHFPKRIADGDTKTSWVEGAKGNGVGEKVFLFPKSPVTGISILPGYGANQTGWNNNNRVSVVTLRFLQVFANGDYQVIDVHGASRFVLNMATDGGMVPFNTWQSFDLGNLWQQNMDTEVVNAVMLEITAVDSKNAKYQDTCIAEVRLYSAIDQ
jgi:hypothetical protein